MAKSKVAEVAEAEDVEQQEEEFVASSVYNPVLVTFTIVGVSPLLQNNPAEFIGKSGADEGLQTKKTYKDEDEARLRCYLNDEGQFVHPLSSFIKAAVRAVTGKKFGKKSAPALIKSSVFAPPEERWCLLTDDKGKPLTKYIIDRQPVVMPNKARVLRCRPSFFPWQIKLVLEVNAAIMAREHLQQALALAGPTVGIGDNRPEKGGPNGRFKVL